MATKEERIEARQTILRTGEKRAARQPMRSAGELAQEEAGATPPTDEPTDDQSEAEAAAELES